MLRFRHLLLIGLVFFLSFLVIFLPASSIRLVTNGIPPLDISATKGSIWRGSGQLRLSKQHVGVLRWSIEPVQLVLGKLDVAWVLQDQDHTFEGKTTMQLGGTSFAFDGLIEPQTINRVLAPYEMRLTGALELKSVKATVERNESQVGIQGDIRWDGGTVQYRMANQRHQRELPALLGKLQTTEGVPSITIRSETEDTPLLRARLDNEGWVHIGITKRFTRLVGQPWHGNESDATIVMEVSEKLL